MAATIRVVVVVEGGVVTGVYAAQDNVEVQVLDRDNMTEEAGDELEHMNELEDEITRLAEVY